ncbi:MAG: hypothetical protein ACE361_10155 [Aureliella sp.]
MLDLYKALGLPAFTDDPILIEQAVERLAIKAETLKGDESKRAQKLLLIAKRQLLNHNVRKEYDKQLRAEIKAKEAPVVAATAVAMGPSTVDWDWSQLDGMLPGGDPQAEFDLSAYLQGASGDSTVDVQQAEEEFAQLLSLVGGEPAKAVNDVPSSPVDDVVIARPIPTPRSQPISSGANQAASRNEFAADAAMVKPAVGGSSTRSIARNIRRKKDRSLLLAAGGMLLSAAIVLGAVMFILNRSDRDADGGPAAGAARQPGAVAVDGTKSNGGGLGGGGGVGRGSGIGSGLGDRLAKLEATPLEPTDEPMTQAGGSPMPVQNAADEAMNPSVGGSDATTGNGMMAAPAKDPMADSGSENGMSPAAPSVAVKLTREEKEAWRSDMIRLRSEFGLQRYESGTNQLARLQDRAVTEEQEEQFIRLSTVANYAEEFLDVFKEAVSGLNAGSVIRVRSNELAFVEAGENQIALRIAGATRRYLFTELPVGILEAIVDLKMDRESGMAKARRAAFLALHPKTNELVLPRARKMMMEAEEQGAVLEGTSRIFDDDYVLP